MLLEAPYNPALLTCQVELATEALNLQEEGCLGGVPLSLEKLDEVTKELHIKV
jgi:hypothetical protein